MALLPVLSVYNILIFSLLLIGNWSANLLVPSMWTMVSNFNVEDQLPDMEVKLVVNLIYKFYGFNI